MINIIRLPAAATRPDGDVALADVAREDTSVVLSDLKALDVHEDGSITLEEIDTALSRHPAEAERQAPGAPADAVQRALYARRRRHHLRTDNPPVPRL